MTEATPKVAPITPVKAGLFEGGAENAIIVYEPLAIPGSTHACDGTPYY